MRQIKDKLYIIIALLFTLVGCEEELLEQTNPNAVTTDSFWKTEADFEKGLNSVYSALQFTAVSGQDLVKGMMRTDLAGSEPWYGLWTEFSDLRWNDATAFVANRWSHLYIGIFRANQLLNYLEDVSIDGFTPEEVDLMKAQARFIRGINYFWLAHTFDGAVIHDALPSSEAEMKKSFSSRSEVISMMVIPDLEYAYNVLPKEWDDDYLGRATWGAAASMLGKTYLYDKDWAKAADYFKEVIDEADNNGLYRLTADIMENFTEEGEFNSESIFEVVFSDNYKEGVHAAKTDPIHGNAGAEATQIASDFASIQGAGGYNTCLPTYWLHELFVDGDPMDSSSPLNVGRINSSRTYATIVVEEGDGLYYNAPLKNDPITKEKTKAWFNHGQSAKVKKYTSWYKKDSEDAANGSRTGINFRHIRLADVYLMYAEAVLERDGEGGVAEAIIYIDKVRTRAGVITLTQFIADNAGQIPELHKSTFANGGRTYTTANKDGIMTHLRMVERPLELCFEGHRWNDIVRWGIAKEIFDDRRAEELRLTELLGNPVTAEPVYPLYLKELVRQDFKSPSENYISDNHDYLPVPSIEVQSNENL